MTMIPVAPMHRSILALTIMTVIGLLGGCSTSGSSVTTQDPSISESTSSTSTPGAPDEAKTGRLVEFTVLAHGVDTDQSFRTAGAEAQLRYGNGRLTGNTTIDDEPASAELLAQVTYDNGSGPFTGFWTFTFGDGSNLALRYGGQATKSGDDTMIVGNLTVLGGTGSYASVTGGGTLHGERTVALGGDVQYRFSLNLSDLPADSPVADEK